MLRYVAFIWNTVEAASGREAAELIGAFRQLAPKWQCRQNSDGLVVFDSGEESADCKAFVLPGGNGLILGQIFSSLSAVSTEVAIDAASALRYSRSGGRAFRDELWGSYVAFFNDRAYHRRYVTRDCSGKIPCFRLKARTVTVVFSDVNDVRSLPMLSMSINWSYIAAFLFYEQLQIRECGVNEITEVLAGDVVEFGEMEAKQSVLWDPRRIAQRMRFSEPTAAMEELRNTTQACVGTWASVYGNIIHSLSGGIDSSVVLSCLTRKGDGPEITCLNRFTEARNEDERTYARLAAAQAKVPLIERHWEDGMRILDERILGFPTSAKPSMSVVAGCLDIDARNELARRLDAEATWTGQGGDHLFFSDSSPLGASDFARQRGMRPGIIQAVTDSAKVSGESYWSVVRSTAADWRHETPWIPGHLLDRKSLFANPDAVPPKILDYLAHPWACDLESLPKGKQFQIYILAEVTNRHRPTANLEMAPEHHPLLSQPLMELCLQIPTYLLLIGGRSRGLVRKAFQGQVPAPILDRVTKGSTTAFWMQNVLRSTVFIRDLLLGGALRRERLIDANSLEPYLDGSRRIPPEQFMGLFACISAELWTRSWMRDKVRAVA